MHDEYVMSGNTAVLKCQVRSTNYIMVNHLDFVPAGRLPIAECLNEIQYGKLKNTKKEKKKQLEIIKTAGGNTRINENASSLNVLE